MKLILVKPISGSGDKSYSEASGGVLVNLELITHVDPYYDSKTNSFPWVYIHFIDGITLLLNMTLEEFHNLVNPEILYPQDCSK